MFARSLIRILSDSGRVVRQPLRNVNISSASSRADRLTWAFTRCYAKDTKRPATKSDSNENVGNEESIEVLDVEKERDRFNTGGDLSKYSVFKDEDSPIILDVEEERLASHHKDTTDLARRTEFDGISLQRGNHGVFDIEELVTILRNQSAQDIVVVELPNTLGYADQMVIISGKSSRHLLAIASYVRRLFKKKMNEGDKIPIIEGKKNKNENWFALDLGNIVLHVFSKAARAEYDLESLWALGPEFDPHLNKPQDPLSAIIDKHSHYLGDLQPADK